MPCKLLLSFPLTGVETALNWLIFKIYFFVICLKNMWYMYLVFVMNMHMSSKYIIVDFVLFSVLNMLWNSPARLFVKGLLS